MIFEIKKLLAASVLEIVVTNAGETYQVEIKADEAVKMTVTGTKEEIEAGLIDHIQNNMKEIHEKKQKGLTIKTTPISKPKPKATPAKPNEKSVAANDSEIKDEMSNDDDDDNNDDDNDGNDNSNEPSSEGTASPTPVVKKDDAVDANQGRLF